MLADDIGSDPPAEQRLQQIAIECRRFDAGQPSIGEVAQPRAEAEAEHAAEDEHMIRCAARVGIVGIDFQP